MDISEAYNLHSRFFFLCGGKTQEDRPLSLSHPFIQQLLHKIDRRGHLIGFHPSFGSYNNSKLFNQELQALRSVSPQPITSGRQHFLRFEVPYTWRLWENAGMEWESSMYYPDVPGFRCGTCYGFTVFDILKRKKLRLKEIPLTAMDVSYYKYNSGQKFQMEKSVNNLIETVKSYKGSFVLLWHNSSFYEGNFSKEIKTYKKIIGRLRNGEIIS